MLFLFRGISYIRANVTFINITNSVLIVESGLLISPAQFGSTRKAVSLDVPSRQNSQGICFKMLALIPSLVTTDKIRSDKLASVQHTIAFQNADHDPFPRICPRSRVRRSRHSRYMAPLVTSGARCGGDLGFNIDRLRQRLTNISRRAVDQFK
jgi:hypothetical protein